jgi:hypothetical protein
MPDDTTIEPLALSIKKTAALTGESRSRVYQLLGTGEYQGVKSGAKTLVLFESIKRRMAGLPRAVIAPPKRPNPHTA